MEDLYFNCGTWNEVPSMDKAQHDNINQLTYCCVEVNDKKSKLSKMHTSMFGMENGDHLRKNLRQLIDKKSPLDEGFLIYDFFSQLFS
jgi:hypothetical protein